MEMILYKTFTLTLKEENISKRLLFELRETFISYPGEEGVCLKILEKNTGKAKYLELQGFKVDPCASFLTEILYKI